MLIRILSFCSEEYQPLVFLAKQASDEHPQHIHACESLNFSFISLKYSLSGYSICVLKFLFLSTFWRYHPCLSSPARFLGRSTAWLGPNTQQEADSRMKGIFSLNFFDFTVEMSDHITCTIKRQRSQATKPQGLPPSDPLPPVKSCCLKIPMSQTAPTCGGHVFKCMSLWGNTSYSDHGVTYVMISCFSRYLQNSVSFEH